MAAKIKEINLQNVKPSKLPLVIGYFGSVHVMHGLLLTKYHRYNVLTFKDFGAKQVNQLYFGQERLDNIARFKPLNIFVYDIAKNNLDAETFIQKVLLKLQPTSIFVGTDFKFGCDHKPYTLLRKYFDVLTLNYNKIVSTTKIAALLRAGNVEKANSFTYFPYYYISEWVKGFQRGKQLGFRTINLKVDHKFMLPEGSYVSRIKIGNKSYKSVSFVGGSKTFNNKCPAIETHVIAKYISPRTVYPANVRKKIKVEFLKFIRANKKFNNKAVLVSAIKNDIEIAKDYFVKNK